MDLYKRETQKIQEKLKKKRGRPSSSSKLPKKRPNFAAHPSASLLTTSARTDPSPSLEEQDIVLHPMPEENDLESEIISFGESTLSGKEKSLSLKMQSVNHYRLIIR